MAIYGDRVALLPQLLDILYYHPEGMRFAELAAEAGRSEADVRETLKTYYLTDLADYLPDLVARPDVLEFWNDQREEVADASSATAVRLTTTTPGRELGVANLSLSDLARLYRLATDAMALHPDDRVLASAVRKLGDGVLPGLRIIESDPWRWLDDLRLAVREHRRVAVRYARAWEPTIEDGVIEPYGLLRTLRGWEIDAAPGDERSILRTYLLQNLRSVTVLPETFDPPQDRNALIIQHRTELAVVLEVPHFAAWAVDSYAERVELITDLPDVARLRVFVLQPYRRRIGLMLVAGGPRARVIEPVGLRGVGAEVAGAMLARYRST